MRDALPPCLPLHSAAWLALLLAVISGCSPPGRPSAADRPVAENKVLDFDVLYAANCAGCHGAKGNLGPAPPLNDELFLAIVPGEVLRSVVTAGRPGTQMPAFAIAHGGPLTDAQAAAIAAGLPKRWGAAPDAASKTTELPQPPAYAVSEPLTSPPSAGAAELFSRACAGCHGANGKGGMYGSIHDTALLDLVSNQVLRRLIITGRPDLGMPDYAGKKCRPDDFQPLTSAEIDELVSLLASWRRGNPAPDVEPPGAIVDTAPPGIDEPELRPSEAEQPAEKTE